MKEEMETENRENLFDKGVDMQGLVNFKSFGFRRDGGAILNLLVNGEYYTTIELEPKDIKAMYTTVQMAEKGLLGV